MDRQDNSVWKLLADLATKEGLTEIIINRPDVVFVERKGEFIQLDVKLTQSDILAFLNDIASMNHKSFGSQNPVLDGVLPDGSRLNAVSSPFVKDGPVITIRKYLRTLTSFDEDQGVFGLDSFWTTFLKAIVHSKMNVIVSGGTGVGKTTMLNMLIAEIPRSERLITIEDTVELSFPHKNSVRFEVIQNYTGGLSLTVRDLVKNSLRMRPDRIIIGEVRGDEIYDLFQAMNVGHDGSMTSLHANSPKDCLSRMETLYLLSGQNIPINVVRKHMSQAIDFIIQLERTPGGKRVVSHITEVTGIDGDVIQLSNVASLDSEDKVSTTGFTPSVMKKLHQRSGLPLDYFMNR